MEPKNFKFYFINRFMRPTILSAITLSIMFSITLSACGEGCLKCNTAFDNCLLCDFVSNYVLNSENTCSIKTREKCQVMNPIGQCLQCSAGYFFDKSFDACLEVPKANIITNCEFYAGLNTCQTCLEGYYLVKNQCLSIQYSIAGCRAYYASDRCSECDTGYVLHPSGNRCISSVSSDCLFKNHLRCELCAPGYALDYNYFVDGLFGNANINLNQAISFITNASIKGLPYTQLDTPCRPLQIANCEEYESFSICKKCAKNYFLSDNGASCKAFPHPALPFCETYTYYNSCSSCIQGYLLAGPNDCQPVRPIVNCKKYSQNSAANVCVECESGYYVNANTCNQRQNIIEKCVSYISNEDKCEVCESSYVLTTDSLACLQIINNCRVYQSSNKTTTQLVCQNCDNGYFYNTSSSTCNPGEVTNCLTYQNNSSLSCQACANEYYLEGGICKPHNEIAKCITYSGLVANECISCDNTSFLNTQNIGCGLIKEEIPQCIEYASPSACKLCNERYYISNGSCLSIPATEHCLIRNDGGLCNKCESGYLLISGVCTLPLDVQIHNCDEIQNDGLASDFLCNKCKKNALSFDYDGVYVCQKSTVLGTNAISNCIKYELDGGVYKCRRCSSGYYISDSNTCVSDISSTATKALILNYVNSTQGLVGDLEKITSSYDYYMTVAGAKQNCKHIVYTNTFSEECLTCKSGKIPIVNLGNKKSHIDPSASNPASFAPNLGYGYNTFTCQTIATPTYYPGASSTVPTNCDTFVYSGSNVYCKSCKKGYTGKVQTHGGINYQNCNVEISDCNTGITYGGLIFEYDSNPNNFDLLVYLSCHSCYTANKIPILFGNSDGSIEPFGLYESDNIPNAEVNKNDNTVQCLEINIESLKYKPEQMVSSFVENCGVAKYNTDITKMIADLDDFNNSPLVCAVCKPGYMPVRLNDIIVRCDPIAHCNMRSSKQWFNSCGECQIGYTWYFNPTEGYIDFSKCVPTTDKNCLASLADDTDLTLISAEYPKGKCAMCKLGYTFNLDYHCEKIDAPLCKSGSYVKGNYVYNSTKYFYDIYNLFNKYYDGCHECESSYVPIKQTSELFACTESNYVELGDFPEDTAYVPFCRHYSRDGATVICRECAEGYITSTNGSFCVDQTVYPNCEKINTTGNQCSECQTGYVLVNEFCERPNILMCEHYDSGLEYQRCFDCIDEYKLVKNKCVRGHVENCRRYDINETCIICNDNYLLVNLANDEQACLRINEELNCKTVSTTKINLTRELECTSCVEGYAPTTDRQLFERYVCQNINPVPNCEQYDMNIIPSNSTLQCTQCKNQFYLKNNACIARQVTTTNCKRYSMVNDFCIECESGFYLSNEKECINFPRGIYGCINYKSEEICTACDKDMYLSSTTCDFVSTLIPNCAYYRDSQTCSKCNFNYYLENNECVKAKALNCATYLRIDRCATCPEGFGLQQNFETGVVDCVYIPDFNCRKSENVYPFRCIECRSLFYNQSGICLTVEQAIENCDLYDSPFTCNRCSEGFILSLDKKQCLDGKEAGITPYTRCVDNKFTLRPECKVCKVGSKFVKGVCTSCSSNSSSSGCMFCSGNNDEYCQICMPGYYMNNSGKCSKNSSSPSGVEVRDVVSR